MSTRLLQRSRNLAGLTIVELDWRRWYENKTRRCAADRLAEEEPTAESVQTN